MERKSSTERKYSTDRKPSIDRKVTTWRPRTTTSQGMSAREASNVSNYGTGGWAVRRPTSQPPGTSTYKRRPLTAERKRSGVRQMDTNPVGYWNSQAKSYDDNIFSTIDEDHLGVISRILDKFADREDHGPMSHCIDLGCGAGKYLPDLAARFGSVMAYDLSPRLAELARKAVRNRNLSNVEVRVRDLSEPWFTNRGTGSAVPRRGESQEYEGFGFAVMANVLIAPVTDSVRQTMLRNALDSLCDGGRLLVIVPSMESALYVGMRCAEAGINGPYKGPPRDEFTRGPQPSEGAELLRGVCKRYGVRTKHFLEAEFQLVAARAGFTVESCEKLTYRWRAELSLESDTEVPLLAREPGQLPWDWLFLLCKGCASMQPGQQPLEPEQQIAKDFIMPPTNAAGNASLSPAAAASPVSTPRACVGVGRLPALTQSSGGENSARLANSSPMPGVAAGTTDRKTERGDTRSSIGAGEIQLG